MNKFQKFSHELSKINNPWERLEKLLLKCLNDKEIIEITKKYGQDDVNTKNKSDLENWLRTHIRFEGKAEETNHEEVIKKFIVGKERYVAAKYVGMTEKECKTYESNELVPIISQKLGFESLLKIPEGMTQFVKKAHEYVERAEKSPLDDTVIRGSTLEIFQLLERIFQELLYAYASWRFKDNPFDTLFTKWITKSKTQDILKSGKPTLGTFNKHIFEKIDNLIQNDDNEKDYFVNSLGRDYLLIRNFEKDDFDIVLLESTNYNDLRVIIENRNAMIHYSDGTDVNALETIKKACKFIEYLRKEYIFPQVVTQKYCIQYYDQTTRIGLLPDSGKLFYEQVEESLEFNCEYYYMRTSPERTFIKRSDWKEVLK